MIIPWWADTLLGMFGAGMTCFTAWSIWGIRRIRKERRRITVSGNCPGRVNPACACDGSCHGVGNVAWKQVAGYGGGWCVCPACTGWGNVKTFASGSPGGWGGMMVPGAYYSPGLSGPGSPGGGSGVIAPAGISNSAPRASGAGMTGFAGSGELDFDPGFDLKPVRGLRQWSLSSPDFRDDPYSEGGWPVLPITGATGYSWPDGVVEAVCGNGHEHVPPVETLPNGQRDGCGFWAYWSMTDLAGSSFAVSSTGRLPILGVVEGYGRVLVGERGFRSQKARIIALAPAFSIQAEATPPRQQSRRELAGREHRTETEQEGVLQRAQQHADAWMAVIQDRLGQLYPSARVFATATGLLASVPVEGRPG